MLCCCISVINAIAKGSAETLQSTAHSQVIGSFHLKSFSPMLAKTVTLGNTIASIGKLNVVKYFDEIHSYLWLLLEIASSQGLQMLSHCVPLSRFSIIAIATICSYSYMCWDIRTCM